MANTNDPESSDRINSLINPETSTECSEVLEQDTAVLPPEHFEHWRDLAGLVGVGVPTETGDVLLWDGPHGWTLPYVEVDSGGDFAVVAKDAIETLTGVRPTLIGVERATRLTYELEASEESLTTHQIVVRAASVDEQTTSEMVSGEDTAVRWVSEFDEGDIEAEDPDDIGDEAEDIKRFLG